MPPHTPATAAASGTPITARDVTAAWWPLAASWFMMALELPAVSAVVARLADPHIHLAAYGGVVFPIALVVEAPIIMLLAASTALSRDGDAYARLRRFSFRLAAALTAVHVLVAATPLYGLIVDGVLHSPPAVRDPARIGLLIMTPWTASIAYRRFQQGVLIRFGRSKVVGIGTAVRLTANFSILAAGYALGSVPGIIVASTAVAAGVLAEAGFIGFSVRPVVAHLRTLESGGPVLTAGRILRFYIPLALTPLLALLSQPLVASGLGRMPRSLESLATWPVINGLVFAFRSAGFAYNEVVVAMLDRPGAARSLRRFSLLLAGATTLVLFLMAATPLGWFWFARVSHLEDPLAAMGCRALWLALPLPALSVFQSWFQGTMVYGHRTRGVSEAMALSLSAIFVILWAGVRDGTLPGLAVGVGAMSAGGVIQVAWLAARSRGDFVPLPIPPRER
jgi:hypothetical protein